MTELWTASALGLLCLVLVGPGPIWVARWQFLKRVPRAAIVLWQAGSVAAIVSVIAAGVLIARPLVGHLQRLRELSAPQLLVSAAIVLFTAMVVVRLVWSLITVARQTSSRRARHRAAVDLVGQVDRSLTVGAAGRSQSIRGLRVLTEQLPIAYCLPGLRDSRVVLSEGTLDRLAPDEISAVLEHETAHVRARHDLVLDTFTALHRAFPIAVRSELPANECRLLVEMLADDAARRQTGPLPLARALVQMAGSPVPHAALGAGGDGDGTAERIQRLAPNRPGYSRPLALAIYALAVGLVSAPLAITLL